MDGVLADLDGAIRRHQRLAGEGQSFAGRVINALKGVLMSPTADQAALWEEIRQLDAFWESLDEIEPGCVARLADLSRGHQWQIIFLTRRPEVAGDTAQRQTQRWLQARGFELPSVYVVRGSRGQIAAALDLDVVIDDDLENCLDVAATSNARSILVCRAPQPPAVDGLGIAVVSTLEAGLNLLTGSP
jgi:hypothetical protein